MDKAKVDTRMSKLTVALGGIKRTITKLHKDIKTLMTKIPEKPGKDNLFKH